MGELADKGRYPCFDKVHCKSSDGLRKYADGTYFCFSCGKHFPKNTESTKTEDEVDPFSVEAVKVVKASKPESKKNVEWITENLQTRGFKDWRVPKAVADFYKIKVEYNDNGEQSAHYYPYEDGKSYKCRKLPKDFHWVGPHSKKLFGRELFNNGGKRLIIAEGEKDALVLATVSYEKYKKFYPVVGLSSSVMANESILQDRDWVRSFDEVILVFDEDEAGEKARKEAIRVVGYDKVRVAKLPKNDAADVFLSDGPEVLLNCVFNASKVMPSGIISKEEIWQSLIDYNKKTSVPYPPCLAGLNTKIKGLRGGEITLFISGTGSGKSTMLREIILDQRVAYNAKVGILSLEESPAETARKLSGMAIMRNPAEEEISEEDLRVGFDKVFDDNESVVVVDHQGSMADESLIDKLEYMCLSGCTRILIDHITILVSEGVENLTGNEAQDKVMNDLLRLVKRYPDVWIGLVSHLRKPPGGGKSFEEGKIPTLDDIRGSGSIKQISFDVVAFARNLVATDDSVRNTIKMAVLKSRYTGLTGKVPGARYNVKTGRLEALDFILEDSGDFTSL